MSAHTYVHVVFTGMPAAYTAVDMNQYAAAAAAGQLTAANPAMLPTAAAAADQAAAAAAATAALYQGRPIAPAAQPGGGAYALQATPSPAAGGVLSPADLSSPGATANGAFLMGVPGSTIPMMTTAAAARQSLATQQSKQSP